MTREGVLSGYYGLYRPPYSLLEPTKGGSIYVVASQYRNTLVLIPLVPNFFVDVVNIIKKFPARDVMFIVPDIGPRFISDYLASWYYIKKKLGFSCRLFSKYMPQESVSEEFLADIHRNMNEAISIVVCRDQSDVSVLHAQFIKLMVNSSAKTACDIAINDTQHRILLACEMNETKLKYYNDHRLYDQIHIPYIEGTYPSMTYNQVMRMCPGLVNEIVVNQFGSTEELEDGLMRRTQVGKLVNL